MNYLAAFAVVNKEPLLQDGAYKPTDCFNGCALEKKRKKSSCSIPWCETQDNIKSNESPSLQEGRAARCRASANDSSPWCPWWPRQRGQAPGSHSTKMLVSEGCCLCQIALLLLISGCPAILLGSSGRSWLDTSISFLCRAFGQAIAS